ncbi:ABC transporter substrate-binding protein [Natrinema thermotolerans]|uniref:ABC transporter substrate-binding protein n=1 Tax=Natrinema thermotolerans TaxID=121872 RepID=A0AAF0PBZ6_9EURY|nr:ABC transporter substrate-binding protein [Natrinema thermotolerans]QCC59321.1 ABC transporter substrate-binding protein [Natrinema thermotolerans]WMT06290.1 ABC transporter substrate-binding protein [Natrinema thermotolerans]
MTDIDISTQQAAIDEYQGDPGDRPVLRARFEHNGSPRYMLYTITRFGIDHDHGFHLDLQLVSDELDEGRETVEAKLQEGDADLIDIDYVSTARERAAGAPIVAFYPYGQTVGGLVVPEDSPIDGLETLSGHRIGVVRRLDKNWILVRAACREFHGFDPDETATPVEAGSKVELTRLLEDGEVDGVLQFWQIIPEIVETGPYREVLPMSRVVDRLADADAGGEDRPIPVSTFLTSEDYLAAHPDAVRGFQGAYRDAVDRLQRDDDLWDEIGERLMYEDDPAVVRAVRDRWREMVVRDWDEGTVDGMERLFDRLKGVAGADALGVAELPDGLFRLDLEVKT